MNEKLCNNCTYLKKQKKAHLYVCFNPKTKFFKTGFSHGKVRNACELYHPYETPLYPLIPQTVPEDMRFIEDLRKEEYKDSDFWIIGTDPNIDFYPDDFFRDKFSIAVNLAWVAFPESTFFMFGSAIYLKQIIETNPDYLKKCFIPLVFIRPNLPPNAIGRWEKWGLDPIYLRSELKYAPSSAPDFEPMAEKIFNNKPCEFTGVRTGVHLAIPATVVLGARRVILVGCSHRVTGDTVYAKKRGIGVDNKPGPITCRASVQTYGRMRRDLAQMARTFKKYNVEIVRHRFDEEKNEFVFEEIIDEIM